MARSSTIALLAALLTAAPAVAQTAQEEVRRQLRHAESLERAGQYSRALVALEQVLQASPAEPGALLAYERISRRQARLEDLLPFVQRAIDAQPRAPLPHQIRLRVLADLGRTDEVRAAGEAWLSIAPRSDTAYQEYARALERIGETARAEAVLQEGRREAERDEAIIARLADLYVTQRRWSDAAAQWIALLHLSAGVAWNLINYKLETLGIEARPVADAILRQLPDPSLASVDERRLAAIAALYAGRSEVAQAGASALVDELEGNQRREFLNRFARVAGSQSQPALVAWSYRQMLGEIVADSTLWQLARQIVAHDLSAGDTATALSTLAELLQRANPGTPTHRWASSAQIRVLAAHDDTDRAERAFELYAEQYAADPELPTLALSLAEAHLRHGRLNEARAILELVPGGAASDAVTARLAASRGYLALYAGDYDDARSQLEIAAATLAGADRAAALRILGFLRDANEPELRAVAAANRALLDGGHEDAHENFVKALRKAPASGARPALYLWAGELAVKAGDVDGAEQALRRIPERYPQSGEAPVALVMLAETLATDGRRAEAISILETLILDYPDSALTPLGRRRLAELREEVPRS